ncbi:hypothetical protein D3C72_1554850 [compost metagenome]
MAVEVDAHAGPIEAGSHLLDMGGLTGAVETGDHDTSVVSKTGKDRECRIAVEQIVGIKVRHIGVALRIGGDPQIRINAENLPHGHRRVGQVGNIKVDFAHHVSKAGGSHPATSSIRR